MRRSRRRKLGIIIYILLFSFIVGGPFYLLKFSPKPSEDYRRKNPPAWVGVLTFWDFPRLDQESGSNFKWIYEKINEFEKEHPGVYIDFQPLDWEKGGIKIETAFKMGNPPDILPISNDYGFFTQEYLVPLNPYLSEEEISSFKEIALEAVTYDHKIWGLPWMMSIYTMVLNLDLFRERGVEPPTDGNWSYEEFIEKLQQLTFDGEGKGKVHHYGLNSFIQSGYYNLWGILLSDGGEIVDKNFGYTFNDEKALSGLQKVIDLKQKYGVTPADFGENTSNKAWTSFYKDQNVAVYPVGTWAINVLDNLQKQGVGFNYTIASFPYGNLKVPISISSGVGAYGVTKQEDEKKLEMCIAFLKFLAKDQYQEELHRLGVFPVKKTVGNIYQEHPIMTMIYEDLGNMKIIPLHPYWKEIDQILQNEIRLGVLGEKTPQEVITDAEEKVKIFMNTVGRQN